MQPPILAALSSSGEMLHSTTDPVSQGLVALVIVGVFVLLTLEYAHRVLVIFGAVAVLWAVTYFTPYNSRRRRRRSTSTCCCCWPG